MAFQLLRGSLVCGEAGCCVKLGKAWIFRNNVPSKPTAATRRPYTLGHHPPPHLRSKHTREAQQSVPPAGFPANMPEGKDRRKTLCLKRKRKKKKVNSPGAKNSLAWHRGRSPRSSAPGSSGSRAEWGEAQRPALRLAALPRGPAESRAGQPHGQGPRAGTRRALAPARALAGAAAGVGSRELTAACPPAPAAGAWPARSRRGSRGPPFSGSHCPRGCPS